MIRNIIRGCGTLPHVGSHPGTLYVLLMIGAVTTAGGQNGGIRGCVVGALMGIVVFGPMYLYGAWDRARLSDKLQNRKIWKHL